jgi:hypothetical protein
MNVRPLASAVIILSSWWIAGCSSSSPTTTPPAGDGGSSSGGTAQQPPIGGANVNAWIAQGDYKSWHCESAVHAARSPSPHGFNRICSNDVIFNAESSTTAPWPEGAAAVKELYATVTDTTPNGYAVYLKTQADSAGGDNWYFYEVTPSGVFADGMGSSGVPNTSCVACHGLAGTDAPHTPSPGGHDFVYTPVGEQ